MHKGTSTSNNKKKTPFQNSKVEEVIRAYPEKIKKSYYFFASWCLMLHLKLVKLASWRKPSSGERA